ncbi:MAG TPA: hypothetical protein VF092_04415 [Longimicrobium sp.]
MPLSIDQIEVTSFATAEATPIESAAYTAPQPRCYSPYCAPTWLPDQCP